jgi:hypothetical protein
MRQKLLPLHPPAVPEAEPTAHQLLHVAMILVPAAQSLQVDCSAALAQLYTLYTGVASQQS